MVEACKEIQKTAPHLSILLKLGDKGLVLKSNLGSAFIDTKGEVISCPPFKESSMPIVDTTGAGDCFTAAFALKYIEEKPIMECMRFASAAAFLCITRKGALPSMPTLHEVEEFLSKHP